jgi:hypothetical protein
VIGSSSRFQVYIVDGRMGLRPIDRLEACPTCPLGCPAFWARKGAHPCAGANIPVAGVNEFG